MFRIKIAKLIQKTKTTISSFRNSVEEKKRIQVRQHMVYELNISTIIHKNNITLMTCYIVTVLNTNISKITGLSIKTKLTYQSYPKMAKVSGANVFGSVQIRSCANERERGRTQSVNGAFLNLR